MSQARITDEELGAFVDGALQEPRRSELVRQLSGDAEAAATVRAFAEQRAALHAAFDPVLAEPVPSHLQRRGAVFPWVTRVAAALALVVIGGAIGWWLRGEQARTAGATLVRQAAIAHVVYVPEARHAVEVAAKEEAHLVGWLSKRLGAAVRAPKLGAHGFELLGGRMLPASGRPGAQFMYQDASGRRLTLFVSSDVANQDTAFRYAHENGVHVFYWVDEKLGYALSGALDKPDMLRVARAVYEQLHQ